VTDEVGDEAFLVLQFHRIEDAPVRIDSNQKIVLRSDGKHVPHFTGGRRTGRGRVYSLARHEAGGTPRGLAMGVVL
ncbi:MAG: hypothetical protein L0Z53_01620, partial [Acidobacteriales bacterium]|nr:hypothetical protein [Terriglobales bacterium]